MVRPHAPAARRSWPAWLLIALVAMVAIQAGCGLFGGGGDNSSDTGGDGTGNDGAANGGTGNDGSGNGTDEPPLQDDFVQGKGAVEGFVYVDPARPLGIRQASGNFILSATEDPAGVVPTTGTRVMVTGGETATLDADGHYLVEDVPAEVVTLAVQETLSGGSGLVTEAFDDIIVAPGHTTLGSEAPDGVSIEITPDGADISTGGTQEFAAHLKDADGNIDGFRDFSWSSSQPGVASVGSGALADATVAGVGAGTATITAGAGALEGSVDVAVTGTASATTVDVAIGITAEAYGADTRVPSLTITPDEGGSVALSGTGSAAFVVSSPDGTTDSVSARTVGSSIGPDGQILIRSGSGDDQRASIALSLSNADLVIQRGSSGQFSIGNRLQLSFPVLGPGELMLPDVITLTVPLSGLLSQWSLSFPGLPDGASVMVIVSREGGAQFSASGVSADGELSVTGFPAIAIPDDITDVVIRVSGP